jgi:ketosteroid isomerase-like protein
MSKNLDLVRSFYAAWERGDFSRTDWAHPEIEYTVIDGPTPGGGRGLASMASAMADYVSPWKDCRVQVEELRPLDADRVLVLLRQHGRGRVSGMELSGVGTRSANVLEIRAERVVKLVIYWNRDRALADLALKE